MLGMFFFLLKEHCWAMHDEIFCSLTTYWQRGFVAFQTAINAAIIEVTAYFKSSVSFASLVVSPSSCTLPLHSEEMTLCLSFSEEIEPVVWEHSRTSQHKPWQAIDVLSTPTLFLSSEAGNIIPSTLSGKLHNGFFPSVSSFFNFPLSTRYFSSVFKIISFLPYYQILLSSMFPSQANAHLPCNISTSWKGCFHLRLDSAHYNFYSHHTTKVNFSEVSNNSHVNQQVTFSFLVLLDLLTKYQHSPGFLSLF